MYATYAYYTGTYKGDTIPEAQFTAYELRAAEEVNLATFNQAITATDAALLPSVQNATCAAADVLYAMEPLKPGTQIISESVGGQAVHYSAAYATMDAWNNARTAQIRQAIRRNLLWTGLMYAGIGVC